MAMRLWETFTFLQWTFLFTSLDNVQRNLSTTATKGMASKWMFKGGDHYRGKIYSKTALFGFEKIAVIGRWLLLRGDRSWRFNCISSKIRSTPPGAICFFNVRVDVYREGYGRVAPLEYIPYT